MSTESPFRRLRLLAGRGHAEFAREAGISLTAMTNIEAGMYERVPVRANAALARSCRTAGVDAAGVLASEYGSAGLDAAMDTWKRWKRAEVDLSDLPAMPAAEIVTARFETPARFCRQLAVPTSTVDWWLARTDAATPDVVREALEDAHYRYAKEIA